MNKPTIEFVLPSELEAHEPPELRGLRRDQVRLLVLPRSAHQSPVHTRFAEIGNYLRSGDLLVVNNSRTLPALLEARDETGAPVEVRLAQRRASDRWDALILNGRTHIGRTGMRLDFGQNLTAQVMDPNPDLPFLWQVQFDICCAELLNLIYRIGVPIRYSYIAGALPLDLYQTVYAAAPGSVEMVTLPAVATGRAGGRLNWAAPQMPAAASITAPETKSGVILRRRCPRFKRTRSPCISCAES